MLDLESLVKYVILPSHAVTMGAIVSFALLLFRPARVWGMYAGIVALALYSVLGAGPVSFILLGHLEYQTPPAAAPDRHKVNTITVLAGYAEHHTEHPLSSQVNSASASRLLETLALFRSSPDSTVIVSGGGEVPLIMREVLVSSGIPARQVRVDAESYSTFESAQHLAPILGETPFLLVTSAGHMPRAIGVFRKAGTSPVPIPTHYLTQRNWLATQYLPSPLHLHYSDLAISEYAALIWYYANGWI